MKRAPHIHSSRPPAGPFLLAALLFLPSCGMITDGAEPSAEEVVATETSAGEVSPEIAVPEPQDCLPALWAQQGNPNRQFDRANDIIEGGSISCATGTTPSEFEAMLSDIRQAAASGNRTALLQEIDVPLLFIDDLGERRDMPREEAIEQHFDEIFSPEMLDLLRRIRLEDMTVVPEQGGFFELGSVWLVATEQGGRPRLRTVNRQALNEAIIAAAAEETADPPATE